MNRTSRSPWVTPLRQPRRSDGDADDRRSGTRQQEAAAAVVGTAAVNAVAVSYETIAAKARGAFYTPPGITSFLTEWAIRDANEFVLEPACGDGAFIGAARTRFAALGRAAVSGHLFGIELEPNEAEKAAAIAPGAQIIKSDFFSIDSSELPVMDAVVGNPPYIRYHGFSGEQRARGLVRAKEQGIELSGLASSWAHFVAHSASFVGPRGRLALVLPAELLHTDYAAPVRAWLLKRFPSVLIVTFDRMAFADAEVDALLLLASHDDQAGLRVMRVADVQALGQLDLVPRSNDTDRTSTRWSGSMDHASARLYLDLITQPDSRRLGAMASVDIGVVTGANRFFILERDEAMRRRLPKSQMLPIIESASSIDGLSAHHSRARALLHVDELPRAKSLIRYLAEGEAAGIPLGYKCRTRSPWYRVPLPKVKPHAFLPYMNHLAPRLIVNRRGLWSTNLLHGVRIRKGAPDVRAMSGAMLSATTMLSAEIEGRAYGGGVLKLETKEAERLVVPAFAAETEHRLVQAFYELDQLVRNGELETASARVDALLGLDHNLYRRAYEVFRQRRLTRKHRRAHPAA